MPTISRPDGAVITYEVHGSGFPLLCFAPGGVNSEITFWERSAINPVRDFGADFRVIVMDQRHAGASFAPAVPFTYDQTVGDQLAVLDDLGIERAHVIGGCIGVAYVLRFIHDAPGRVAAAVCQDPVGLDETNSIDVFNAMFQPTLDLARAQGVEAVVASALENPLFVANNAGGPFARRIAGDATFRQEVLAMGADRYIALIEGFRAGIWPDNPPYFTVSEEWLRGCPAPLLVLPGRDHFHPTTIARRICREAPKARCLEPDCREPANLPATIDAVRQFLKANTPA